MANARAGLDRLPGQRVPRRPRRCFSEEFARVTKLLPPASASSSSSTSVPESSASPNEDAQHEQTTSACSSPRCTASKQLAQEQQCGGSHSERSQSSCGCWAAVRSVYRYFNAARPSALCNLARHRHDQVQPAVAQAPMHLVPAEACESGVTCEPHLENFKVFILTLLSADAVWVDVLSFCNCQEAVALAASCRETARGATDRHGRLLVGAASLTGLAAEQRLARLSPHVLARLNLPGLASGSAGEGVLAALAAIRHELCALKEVSVHLTPPRLPRVSGESREERTLAVSVLAGALSAALPCWLDSFEANLRGGCLLAGEGVLADFASAIPKRLTRLELDLNHFSTQDARAVAKVLPASLRELRLLFHGRSFAWLGEVKQKSAVLRSLHPRCQLDLKGFI
eukprot:gb/GFBE01049129.1/.p1 GENE.gb/GFBE01049129.1/~~gb/GFBE01049129.1/.p1  ORF type:complete len:400 (+),score=46.40 gb/GFBE01049129.1/:1-1200(+)